MLTVFIKRFEICFENSVFGYSKRFIRIVYGCLIFLTLFSLVIVIEIIRDDHDVYTIIISEIIWELMIEIMCLWLLYLFISKLYKLLQVTLNLSMNIKTQTKMSRFNELKSNINSSIMETKLTSNRSHSNHSKSDKTKSDHSKDRKLSVGNKSKQSHYTSNGNSMAKDPEMTVNTAYDMENLEATKNGHKSHIIQQHDHEPSYTMPTIHSNLEIRDRATSGNHMVMVDNATSDIESDLPCNHSDTRITHHKKSYDPQIIDVVNVMNKMTLLVVISVLSSILSVVGNIFVEIHELETIQEHTADMGQTWGFMLPVIDVLITSSMLYLQFNFSQDLYSRVCLKCDIWFLRLCLNLNHFWITRKNRKSPSSSPKASKGEVLHTLQLQKNRSFQPKRKKSSDKNTKTSGDKESESPSSKTDRSMKSDASVTVKRISSARSSLATSTATIPSASTVSSVCSNGTKTMPDSPIAKMNSEDIILEEGEEPMDDNEDDIQIVTMPHLTPANSMCLEDIP